MTHRILILGGTTEARQLAARLAGLRRNSTSRCRWPAARASRCLAGAGAHRRLRRRRGAGRLLFERRIDLLIDATHPFAAQMSRNAALAAAATRVAVLRAPPPRLAAGRGRSLDRCRLGGGRRRRARRTRRAASSWRSAARKLAPFDSAPQHSYLVRSVDPVDPPLDVPHAHYILARGPFGVDAERKLLVRARIDVVRRQEQRRRCDLRQDRGGARARHRGDHGRAPAARPTSTVETVAEVLALAGHRLRLPEARRVDQRRPFAGRSMMRVSASR